MWYGIMQTAKMKEMNQDLLKYLEMTSDISRTLVLFPVNTATTTSAIRRAAPKAAAAITNGM